MLIIFQYYSIIRYDLALKLVYKVTEGAAN